MSEMPNIVLHVDTTQLSKAIELALSEFDRRMKGEPNAPHPIGLLAAGAVVAGSCRKISRRGLLGLGWLKR